MKKLLYSIILISLFAFSCKKHGAASEATITIVEPMVGDTIQFGEELHVEGTITGDGELHGYSLKIENTNTSEIVKSAASSDHAKSYVFHEHWVNNVTEPALMKVTVEVEINHDGKKTSKELNVVCLPN
ncbi:MAG: hypothetical protein FGM14_12090 [Flavobacteriales bacterium]|nr:hypothetical protein [Flavobacteriales bacterium]